MAAVFGGAGRRFSAVLGRWALVRGDTARTRRRHALRDHEGSRSEAGLATEMTADQLRERNVNVLGPTLGPTYHELSNQVVWLHAKWNQYRQLYAHSPDRIETLNAVARHLFGMLQDIMLENVLLDLGRLTDPRETGKKSNLTLQRLPDAITDATLAIKVRGLVEAAVTRCAAARDWRNRRIAHRDLALAVATGADPLPGISRADVEAALESVRAVLHAIEGHYFDSETAYQHFIASGGEAGSLTYYIKAGLRAEEKRLERFRDGSWTQEDLVRDDG
jgi:hypothetical protein